MKHRRLRNIIFIGGLMSVVGVGLMGSSGAYANEGCFVHNDTSYNTFSEARNAMSEDGGSIVMACDVEITNVVYGVTKDVVLDLNGHVFSQQADSAGYEVLRVMNGHTLTVTDSSEEKNGKIISNRFALRAMGEGDVIVIDAGTIESSTTYAAIALSGSEIVLNDGKIVSHSSNSAALYGAGILTMNGGSVLGDTSGVEVNDGGVFNMIDGNVDAGSWGIIVFNDSEFTMDGGTITAGSIAVSGNGTTNPDQPNYGANAKFILNAGMIKSGSLGVYAPQVSGLTKLGENLVIEADEAGVEVRAGELIIDGATISVDPEASYLFNPNGNGSTASGVAIAVAQHTTKQAISTVINSGKFTAPVAFGESNPQNNGEEDIEKVNLSITGGEFNATNGDPVVTSEDISGFISGGTFNKVLDDVYVANDHDLYSSNNSYIVDGLPIDFSDKELFLQNGESKTLDLGMIGNKYATLSIDGDIVNATIDDKTIVATADGSSKLSINYNGLIHPKTEIVDLVVYSVGAGNSDGLDDDNRNEIADFATAQVKDLLETGEDANNSLQLFPDFDEESGEPIEWSGLSRLKDALINNKELITSFDTLDYVEDHWYEQEGMDVVKEHLVDDERIAAVYGVELNLCADSCEDLLGQLTDLGEKKVEFDLEIPDAYLETPRGFVREFSVLRFHRGVWDRLDAVREGNVLKVSSNEFSTYVVAYTDVVDSNKSENESESNSGASIDSNSNSDAKPVPNTGASTFSGTFANSVATVAAVIVGILTSIVTFVYLKRN